MNLSIRHFKAFLAVVQSRSFTRAAEIMHISQPGLSLMMREMESQLTCRLFDRTTRSVEMTAAAQRLLPVAQQVVNEVEAITPVLNQMSDERRRTLKIGVPPVFASSVIPDVYMRLRKTQPALDLYISDLPKPEVERQVRDGELDCGLGSFPRRIPEVSRRLLFEFDFIYLESHTAQTPAHQRFARYIRWRDLPDVPFVEQDANMELQAHVNKCRAAAGISRSDGMRLNGLASQVAMAVAGVGPTIIPSFAVPVDTQAYTALLIEPVLSLGYHLIMKRGREQSDALEGFIRTLLEVIEERKEQTYPEPGV
ncbi:LysR family transcriptional regulator [Paraburkholderia tropica]|uniref:LysR family transcriptional regulator n=1 Tax=Paraburkholderia tropica TaxID=92647 RepID=UPI002AAF8B90|nr:LysR family transcriptional regulator [Paraburkholderia tropica]